MAAGLAQLRSEARSFGMTDKQLDRICELFDDPELLLHGHLMYSTSGMKPRTNHREARSELPRVF
jgi:hypothetical protein